MFIPFMIGIATIAILAIQDDRRFRTLDSDGRNRDALRRAD